MPRAKGPHLWFRPARHDDSGKLTHKGVWLILDDGARDRSTGLGIDASESEKSSALGAYLTEKHTVAANTGSKDPSQILIDDVLAKYAREVVPNHADPAATVSIIQNQLRPFWCGHALDYVNGDSCDKYAEQCNTRSMARKTLEILRAAINYHRKRGLHDRIVSVSTPDKEKARERYFERDEAAAAIWAAWRFRECTGSERRPRKHVAHFMVFARYMGSRATVICSTSIKDKRPPDVPWCDLRNGIFHGLPEGERVTNKRRQRVRIPPPLLAHLRRWRALGQQWVVEYGGHPVTRISHGHDAAIADAGLDDKCTPHTWRHSVASWLMQASADPWKASAFLAMSYKTLLDTYGHHRPDDTAGVHAAFHEHRRQRTANATSERNAKAARGNVVELPTKRTTARQ